MTFFCIAPKKHHSNPLTFPTLRNVYQMLWLNLKLELPYYSSNVSNDRHKEIEIKYLYETKSISATTLKRCNSFSG